MSERPGPTPREWVGERPYPWPPTLSLADLEDVVACFSIHSLTVGRTRNDAPFLRLLLADCYGTVEARMWDGVETVIDALRPGIYVGVRGRLERYQEERQLRIEEIGPLSVELDDLVLFLPRSARPAEHMEAELTALIASVRDAGLRQLLERMLSAGSDVGSAFRMAPAAKQNHHAYLGGLLEHTLSMAHVCDLLAQHYGAAIDRDLLIAGALLHDVGKIREIGALAGFPYTDEGKLLGHILIGLQMVADAGAAVPALPAARLLLLQHLIASHQGRYEWQSPREPRTLEALILHYADDLDAKLAQATALVNAVDGGWTAYDRSLGRDFLRHIRSGGEQPSGGAIPPAHLTRAERRHASPASSGREATGEARRSPTQPAAPAEGVANTSPALDTLDLFEDR